MLRKITLRVCAFLLIASLGSSANACGLFPFLNPFAWTCGYGYGGYGNACCGYGYGAYRPWYGGGWGCGYRGYRGCRSGYYGYGYGHGYGYGGSIYTPSYPAVAPAADCNCGAVTPSAPISSGTAWSVPSMTAPSTAWSSPGAWRPQYQWTPPATAWQSYPNAAATWSAPQTAMSTAPVAGPSWEVSSPSGSPAPQVAGDIHGDHEFPVVPNGFQSGMGAPVHPASYRTPVRRVRHYSGVVR